MPSFLSPGFEGDSPPHQHEKPSVRNEDGRIRMASERTNFPTHSLTKIAEWRPARGGNRAIDAIARFIDDNRPIDLVQYRIADYTEDSYIQDLQHLSNLHKLGKFKHLGLIDVDAAHLELILDCGFPVTHVQVSCSILDRRYTKGRAATVCAQRGITVLARNALLAGFLHDELLGQPEILDSNSLHLETQASLRLTEAAGCWAKFQSLLDVLATIAEKHNVSIGAVAARHILDIPWVGGIVIDSKLAKGYQAALSLTLNASDHAKIEAVQTLFKDFPETCDGLGGQSIAREHGYGSDDSGKLLRSGVSQPIANYPRWEFSSGSKWEPIAGYRRAVRIGNRIRISGTTANSPIESLPALGGHSARSQLVAILDIIERALTALGASMRDMVHTRIMVVDAKYCDEVSEVHGDRFRPLGILPANTLVANGLMEKQYLVEVEAEAEVIVSY